MASIRERTSKTGQTTYSVLFRAENKQTSMTFATPKAAADFAALVEILGPSRAIAELAGQQAATLTVDQLADKFFAWKARDITPRTLTDYRRDYEKWIKPTLGARSASSVDERDVQGWVDDMATHLEPKSVADRHMILSGMFKFGSAKSRGLVDHNPCLETELPRRKKRSIKGVTPNEWRALYAAARQVDPDAADLLLFIVSTGWRWSEAAALSARGVEEYPGAGGRMVMVASMTQVFRKDAQLRQQLAVDEAKTQAGLRSVKLPATCATMLRRRLVGLGPDDLVFTNRTGRKWYQQNFLNRTWSAILDQAGLDRRPTPHHLRHGHVVLLDRTKKVSMPEIQRRLGHESIQTTVNVYGTMIDDISDEALDALDALLTDDPPTIVSGDVVRGEVTAPADAPARTVPELE